MGTDERPTLVDSNILVYAYSSDDTEKKEKCTQILNKCWKGEAFLAVSTQNLSEFYWVSTTKATGLIANEKLREILLDIINSGRFIKLTVNPNMIIKATELCERYNVKYWDSLIAAAMLENNIARIYTENTKDFLKIPGIYAINPLK